MDQLCDPSCIDRIILDQKDLERTLLRDWLWDLGYGNAEVRDTIALDPLTHTAALDVVIEPGPLTTIGEVTVEGNERVSDYTVTRLLDLPRGSPYRRLFAAQAVEP